MGKRFRGFALALGVVVLAALVAAGCGEADQGPGKSLLDQDTTPTEARQDYLDGIARVQQTLEDSSAPPLQQSISVGNRNQLQAAAQRWDAGLALLKSLTPPSNVKNEHALLVKAMAGLSVWNHKIANAAPNRKRTKALFKQAQNSADSTLYGQAIDAFQKKGYDILGAGVDSSTDPGGDPSMDVPPGG